MSLLLGELIRRNSRNETFGSKVAMVEGNTQITYSEFNKRVNRIANAILALGFIKGERVAVLGRNSIDYAAIYFALAKIGAIMVPLNFNYKGEEIKYAVAQSECSFFLLESAFQEMIEAVRPSLTNIKKVVYFGVEQVKGELTLASLIANSSEREPSVSLSENDPRVIMYTSGTTGFPKGATLSHRQQFLHTMIYASEIGLTEHDIGIQIYPLFHAGGMDCMFLPFLWMGAKVVFVQRPDPEEILKTIEKEKATFVFCVPTVWRRILNVTNLKSYDINSVRICISASDTINRDDLEGIKNNFPNAAVTQIYGLTEAGVISHFLKPEYHWAKLGSVGRAHPLIDCKIVDEGKDVAVGGVGEVILKGPTIMVGYWKMEEKAADAIRDGWLYTGDLGKIDEDGFLYLMGRNKDMIISGGENIYPAEIERVLREHRKIKDVAVVGVPDKEWSESVLAVIVPEEGESITKEEVIQFVRSQLAGYKKPKYVEFVNALPVTSATSKVQKSVLREKYKHIGK